jgi:hypothetical protein
MSRRLGPQKEPLAMIGSCHSGIFFALALVVGVCLAPAPLTAQPRNVGQPPDRTVPGFSASDSSLMSVEHIDPLHATSITLFSTLRNDDLLPRDISVEFLPWLPKSPDLDVAIPQQFDKLKRLSPADVVRSYAAISLAISQGLGPEDPGQSASQVALGFRTFLLAGRLNHVVSDLMDEYIASVAEVDAAQKARQGQPSDRPADDEADQKLAILVLRARSLVQEIARAPKNRVGFLMETGFVQVLRVPENALSQAQSGRRAVWLTPIYRLDARPRSPTNPRAKPEVDFAGIARFIYEPETDSRLVDVGARVGARSRGIYYSIEALARKRLTDLSDPDDDLKYGRVVGAVAYGFNRTTQVHFTFGKNFSHDYAGAGSLLASFGLTVGLGEIPFGSDPRND